MFQNYPSVGRYGHFPWSALMANLSSKMRSQRFKMKHKGKEMSTASLGKGYLKKAPLFQLKAESTLKGKVLEMISVLISLIKNTYKAIFKIP